MFQDIMIFIDLLVQALKTNRHTLTCEGDLATIQKVRCFNR